MKLIIWNCLRFDISKNSSGYEEVNRSKERESWVGRSRNMEQKYRDREKGGEKRIKGIILKDSAEVKPMLIR